MQKSKLHPERQTTNKIQEKKAQTNQLCSQFFHQTLSIEHTTIGVYIWLII